MTQQKTHEELKKELAGVVAHFQALLDAMEPTPPQPAAPEPVPEPVPDPKKEPSGVAQLLETVPASVQHAHHYQELTKQDAYGTHLALRAAWDTVVQMNGKKAVDEGYARAHACTDSSTVQRMRPSPWHDIMRAMGRNETCVLYCKHADDGWTDALWDAAIAHLNENGVRHTHGLNMYNAPDDKKCQYWMLWWPACVSP